MDFLPKEIVDYAEAHTTPHSELLQRISRETHLKILNPRMLSGQLQGQLLTMLSCMICPQTILEIGTFTGYSALCLAAGLVPNGKIITIERNEELENFARKFFQASEYAQQIDFRIGNARQIIPTLNETFDLIFIDADKPNYTTYYDLVFDKLRTGGIIIADNVLWGGKIVEPTISTDKSTQGLLEFNKKVANDSRVAQVLLPVRDGLLIIRKL